MKHRAVLTEYAAKILGNRAEAEDILQEAWVSLAARGDSARAEVLEPLGYLRAMVRNLAIDALRRRARESRFGGEDMDVATRTVADGNASPENTLSARRDLDCVLGVLRSLPERQRIAIEMYRFGDHKLREIAAHLGVSVALVHLLIADGLAACVERCGIDRRDLK